VLVLSGGLLLTDFALRLKASNNADPSRWAALDAGVYALGELWSVLTWIIASLVLARLLPASARLRAAGLAALALLCGAIFMSSFGYRLSFYQSPSWQVVKFAVSEPQNVWRIFAWSLTWAHGLAFLAFSALTWTALARATRAHGADPPGSWRSALPLGIVYAANSVLTLATPGFQDPLPVEANSAAAFAQYLLAATTSDRHLVAPLRPAIPPQPARDRPDVLLLLHESLRADAQFADLGYSDRLDARALSPFTSTLPARKAEGFYVFPLGRCNATATESSLPTVLSGVELGADTDAYGRAQSVWSLGKAAGSATFLYSAQTYAWSHFDEYFFDQNLDVARTGLDLAPAYVNDVGVDDRLAIDAAFARMRQLRSEGKHFLGVIHFNATHVPGYPGPGVAPDPDETLRYLQAVGYIDTLVKSVIEGLERDGLDAGTVVLSTADHGEPLDSPRRIRRLGSLYDETTRVPFWVRVPPDVAARFPGWTAALAAWQPRNVQNIDILPTIRDALRLDDAPELLPPAIPGRSLLRPPGDEPDLVSGQSTCAFRAWTQEGLYIVNGTSKLLLSNERSTPEIYDLAADPAEHHNLWPDAAARARVLPWATAWIRAGKERTAACRRAGTVCILDGT
jgi:glucan phosphoethanolaminetransferase (alkaline phosphatase superfamily)